MTIANAIVEAKIVPFFVYQAYSTLRFTLRIQLVLFRYDVGNYYMMGWYIPLTHTCVNIMCHLFLLDSIRDPLKGGFNCVVGKFE